MRYRDLTGTTAGPALYHAMGNEKAYSIFETNSMPARWISQINGQSVKGNSMSRNRNFWFQDAYGFRLTFDRRLLKSRHRIVPIDAEDALHRTHGGPALADRSHSKGFQFAEEFVAGDISPLNRVVTGLEIRRPDNWLNLYNTVEMARDWCDKYHVPLREDQKITAWMIEKKRQWDEDE